MGKMKERLLEIMEAVQGMEVGPVLDEAVGKEVYKLRKVSKARKVRDPFAKTVLGTSNWVSADNKPILLPKFSTVAFVAVLTLDATDAKVVISRTGAENYKYSFLNEYDGIEFTGKTMAEVVAKGSLFHARAQKLEQGV